MKPLFLAVSTFGFAAVSLAVSAAHTADKAPYVPPEKATPHGEAPHARSQLLSDVNGRRTYALILKSGDEVFTALSQFAREHQLRAAHFTAIGALRDVELGWYDLGRRAYKVNPVQGQVEALSVIGDVGMASGAPVVHAHVVVGAEDGTTRGGHLLHAVASPTLEVFVVEEPAELRKEHDQDSGLTLFEPAP